jgi:hypothetical protein
MTASKSWTQMATKLKIIPNMYSQKFCTLMFLEGRFLMIACIVQRWIYVLNSSETPLKVQANNKSSKAWYTCKHEQLHKVTYLCVYPSKPTQKSHHLKKKEHSGSWIKIGVWRNGIQWDDFFFSFVLTIAIIQPWIGVWRTWSDLKGPYYFC